MFFSDLLKRIREKNQKRTVVRDLIDSLPIDAVQKSLYYQSLEILEDDMLDIFYTKLITLIGNTEKKLIQVEWEKTSEVLQTIKQKELQESETENSSFNILFNNM